MRVVLFCVMAAGAACGGAAPTMQDAAILQFVLRSPEPGTAESASAAAGRGQVEVSATFSTPNPCQTLTGELEQAGRALTLRVSIRSTGDVCVQTLGRFAYDARIGGLSAGRYSLNVVHAYPSTGWPTRTILDVLLDVR